MKNVKLALMILSLALLSGCSPTASSSSFSPSGDSSSSSYNEPSSSDSASSSSNYEDYSPAGLVNLALDKFMAEETYYVLAKGETVALFGITQSIYAMHMRSGSSYFEESISGGMVNVYDRMWEEGETTVTRWGNSWDYESMEEKSMSNEEYVALMGRKVSDLTSYVIADSTVINGETLSGLDETSVSKTSDGYTVHLELDPEKATEKYAIQMQTISGLRDKPSFDYCHLTFYLDEELNILSSVSNEKYGASLGPITSPCTGELISKYRSGGEVAIPQYESTESAYESFDSFEMGHIN